MNVRSMTAATDPPRNAVATLPEPARIDGTVERVLFHDPTGPYSVLSVRAESNGPPVTVVGRFPEIRVDEGISCTGSWQYHQRYGRQFHAGDVTLVIPASVDGLRRYLTSPLAPGIGPVTARRLVDYFGVETIAALDAGEEALRAVTGIGPVRAEQISSSWREHQALRQVMLTLFDFGISHRRALRIYERYGTQAPLVVRSDPYRLAIDVTGIGFHTADRIALTIGIPHDAPSRLQASVLQCLQTTASDGSTWMLSTRLVEEATALLSKPPAGTASPTPAPVPEEKLELALQTLAGEGKVATGVIDGEPVIALVALDAVERALAHGLQRLMEAPVDRLASWQSLDDGEWDRCFAELPSTTLLSVQQRAAIKMALTSPVSILTGGPGTGKTTALRTLVALALDRGARLALAAPTGRAAQRLSAATRLEARTLHRLLRLGYRGAGGEPEADLEAETVALAGLEEESTSPSPRPTSRGRLARLNADLIVVDEASMLDVALARALVRAVPPGAHLLLVGDADQLPSVGPGQVLADLISSGRIPVTRLERIFRQGEGSGIAANAQRINAGEMPVWEPGLGTNDFYLVNADDVEHCRERVVELVARRIPERFGLSGTAIQVLAPMYRGPVGLTSLNPALQEALNPPRPDKPEISAGARLLRDGDRVVQSRNNYELGVFNGDMGSIVELDPVSYVARVLLDDGREVVYPPSFLSELQLAYALSVHRAQGSEFPAVVLPVVTGQFILLSRRLFYTAVTRAQRLVVLVGHSRAVSFAVRDAGSEARLTALAARLLDPSPYTAPPATPHRGRRQRAIQPALL